MPQHTIERSHRADQFGTCASRHHTVEQGIDSRVLDAHEIARPLNGSRGRPEALQQLGARRLAAQPTAADDLEIKHIEPFLQDGEVNHTVSGPNAQAFQIFGKRGHHTAHRAAVVKELDGEHVTTLVAQCAVAVMPTRSGQQVARPPQVVAQGLTRIGV